MKSNVKCVLLVFSVGLLSLTGCSKKEETTIESSAAFGELESTAEVETTKDIFAVDDPNIKGYEIRETTATDMTLATRSAEEVNKELEEMLAEIEETRDVEQESRDALVSDITLPSGEVGDLTEISDGIVDPVVDAIIEGAITDMDQVKTQLDKGDYPEDYKEDLIAGFEELLRYWQDIHARVAADPIDPAILAEHPEYKYYTNTEYQEFMAYQESVEESAGGAENITKEITHLDPPK